MGANRGYSIPPGTTGAAGPQGDPGTPGVDEFTELVDLQTAVVATPVLLTTSGGNSFSLQSVNAGDSTSAKLTLNSGGTTGSGLVSQSANTAAIVDVVADETNLSGHVALSGAINNVSVNYGSGDVVLDGNYSIHVFTGDPGAPVTVAYLTNQNMFWCLNKSGTTVTLAGNNLENFNGASTIVLADGVGYGFVAPGGSKDYVVFSTAALTTLLTQTIDDDDTTHAPSGDAVFEALAVVDAAIAAVVASLAAYAPINDPTFTGTVNGITPIMLLTTVANAMEDVFGITPNSTELNGALENICQTIININGAIASGVIPRLMPSGGTTGQVLAKASNTNYDVAWVTP